MRFFKAVTFLSLGLLSHGAALPVEERQVGGIPVLQNAVGSASTAILIDLAAITTAIAGSLGAQDPVIAAVRADIAAVTAELTTAAQIIANTTLTLGTTLTAPEIVALQATIAAAQALAITYTTALQVILATLSTSGQAAVQAELSAAIAAFTAFTAPLITFAGQVQAASAVGSAAALAGLQTATASLVATIHTLTGV